MKYKTMMTICAVIIPNVTLFNMAIAGSLYSEESYESLVGDHRSLKVGDIITVLIYEAATATTSTDTETDKSVDVGASAGDGHTSFSGDVGVASKFNGGGTSQQTGKLVASVSVPITQVLTNGDLIINGMQELEFNNDMQMISVNGRVRKQDVSSQNTVLSTRLANAKIKFVGDGLLSSRAEPGIITRFINWLF